MTHKDVTRYFMTIPEAVQLVHLQSSLVPEACGNIAMLEMGEPVKILELARSMIRLSGRTEGYDASIEAVLWTGPPPARTIVILGEGQGMDAVSDLEAMLRSGSRFEVLETFPVELGDGLGRCLAEAIDSQGADTVVTIGQIPGRSYSEIVDVSLTHGCRLLTTPRTSGVLPRSVLIEGVRFVELTAPSLKAPQWFVKRLMTL